MNTVLNKHFGNHSDSNFGSSYWSLTVSGTKWKEVIKIKCSSNSEFLEKLNSQLHEVESYRILSKKESPFALKKIASHIVEVEVVFCGDKVFTGSYEQMISLRNKIA